MSLEGELNLPALQAKIRSIESQVIENATQIQQFSSLLPKYEERETRITRVEDEIANLKRTLLEWQSLYDTDLESESETDRKADCGRDARGHIQPVDFMCSTNDSGVASTEGFLECNSFDPRREGKGFRIQQESCTANMIQPQSEPIRPNSSGEGDEHVDTNPSFSPGLVAHYGDQEGFNDNTVPKRLNGEAASQETTPKDVASAAVGGKEPPEEEGLHDDTIPKNFNEEAPVEENTPTAAASTASEPPENEPPCGNSSSGTGLNLTQNIPQTQIPENCCAVCSARQEAGRRNAERHCNGMQQQSTNTKRDFKKNIEDGSKPLKNRNRKALRENLPYLICYLHPVIDDVVNYMYSHFVLSDRQREKIASKSTETDKCEHLVTNVLLHSSEKTFWVFMQALEDNNCEFIVNQLLGKPDDVTGHIRATVDIREERRTSEDAQRCLQVVLRTIDKYIFNNPSISRSIADDIRNILAEHNLIVTGLSRGSILINMKFYTVEQLDAFWMWVKSRQPSPLSTSLTEVILTEEIRNTVQEDLILSLSTDMDLDEYLKKRRRLLHGDLPMTSDDLNFGKHPLKQGSQSLSWIDIAGQPKMEANPKVLLEWAYESGHYDPLPLLTKKFPQTFTGYDEKDFRIERLHKLITYKNDQISQLISKLSKTEHKLKKAEDALVNIMNHHQDTLITYKVQHCVGEEDHRNKDNKPELWGPWIRPDSQIAPPMNAPNGEVNAWKNNAVDVVLKEIESQASGGHIQPVCNSKVDDKIHPWIESDTQVPMGSTGGYNTDKDGVQKNASVDLKQTRESDSQASGGHSAAVYDDSGFHGERVYGERVHGLSTVICVDTSGSMEGEAFTDMKNAINKILDDAEYTKNVYEFKELIGLVQCGSGSDGQTIVSLTDNYNQIRRALDRLSPSGMSPLATGIREAVHELKRHSSVLVVSRQMVPSRLLVFTDGIPTDENDYGSTVDLTRASTAGKYKVMTAVQRPFNEPVSLQARINFIGCGKRCDRVFLENAAKAGKGKFFRADDELDVRRLGGYYRRLVWVCRFICPFREKEFINQLVNTKNTFSTWMRATKSTEIFDTDLSDFDMDEMYEILQELIGPKALTDLDVEDLQRTALIQRELPLGIRVRRGPDWEYGDQDNNGPGTVSGYEKGGWVKVQWDHSNEDFVYRYGHDGRREVQVVNEPRILRDDEFIKPGVKVRRGPHWNGGNNDGGPGSIGTVYKVEEAGIVYVLWPTRVASNHRYGYDGRFEVELVEESTQHEGDEDGSGFITDDGKVALWQWNSNGNWTAYPKYVNTKLERSYRTRPSTSVEVNVAGLCQRINFESMTALCTDINETYEIQRTELTLEVFEAVRVGLEGY